MTPDPEPNAPPAGAIPAATVILFRHNPAGGAPQVMLLERAANMRFAGGAVVFPGGRVDPADRELASAAAPDLPAADSAARIAAIRETLEETGLVVGVNETVTAAQARAARALVARHGALGAVLDTFGWTLDISRLLPFAHWCPPLERAFDTRFYLADLGTGAVEVAEDGTENTRIFWATAAEVLSLEEDGHISALFPTLCNLHRLAGYESFERARADALAFPPRRLVPQTVTIDGVDYFAIPEDTGYPLTRIPRNRARKA